MSLNEQISKLVKDNLPAAVGEELKAFITNAQHNEGLLASAKEKITSLEGVVETQRARLVDQKDLETREGALKTGLAELAAAQLKLAHESAGNRALVAEAGRDVALSMFAAVFKNPDLKKIVMENTHVVMPANTQSGGYPNQPYALPIVNTQTTTQSTE